MVVVVGSRSLMMTSPDMGIWPGLESSGGDTSVPMGDLADGEEVGSKSGGNHRSILPERLILNQDDG
jgi:hypothetical protein